MALPFPLLDAHLVFRGTPLPAQPRERLERYAKFVSSELEPVTFEVDRRARPYLAHHDTLGGDPEEVVLNPAHRAALSKIYASGLSTGAVEGRHPWWETFALGYLTTDVGCFCSATVTMATAFSLAKYGSEELKARFLPALLEGGGARQGATWATEAQGGSDLGANRARAVPAGSDGKYTITGEKYFCSNVGASYAVVTARPEGAPEGPKGIRLFFAPSRREDGRPNWRIRRLKDKMGTVSVPTGEVSLIDSEAYLLGTHEERLYPTMEMLNVSRVCNSIGSAGVLARALQVAMEHARAREAFGKRLIDHPLMAVDLARLAMEASTAALLAFDPAFSFDEVWKDRPPKSDAALLFRLATHAAKLATADQAVRGTYSALEVLGGPGYLEEFPLAKLVRDAMVTPVWEGGSNRQALDAWEVSTRSHPEKAWHEEAKKAAGAARSDAVKSFLERRIGAVASPGHGEVSAKSRLMAIAEMRQMTLLQRLAHSSAEPADRARAEATAEIFALVRDGGPGTDIPVITALSVLGAS
ncbi:MAG: acyl-CoA dehydrogenase family protein [Euryarchaeota archaeon]|nr:acyl-CoA dehydrogenase family protein [Euryarchaeota archaeon]MDE1836189.1 acyl-CoA dehydrogenase family protein [Euryarchaeota archaeon]MDE1881636.1 acyl-CoA dehydrogenase family protein [Euryarchaeota archaeon]MDE2045448.1 acyl-CoA dehydrogenase family protein [Thermoplasmata archaeon]